MWYCPFASTHSYVEPYALCPLNLSRVVDLIWWCLLQRSARVEGWKCEVKRQPVPITPQQRAVHMIEPCCVFLNLITCLLSFPVSPIHTTNQCCSQAHFCPKPSQDRLQIVSEVKMKTIDAWWLRYMTQPGICRGPMSMRVLDGFWNKPVPFALHQWLLFRRRELI